MKQCRVYSHYTGKSTRAHLHHLRKPPHTHSQACTCKDARVCRSSCLKGSAGLLGTWSRNSPMPANTKKKKKKSLFSMEKANIKIKAKQN